MASWMVYTLIGATLTGLLCWVVAGALLLIAGGRGITAGVRLIARNRGTEDLAVGPDSRTGLVWMACHSTRCAHLQTEHDVLAPGRFMCRRCDHVTTSG